jgi:DNA processing protein
MSDIDDRVRATGLALTSRIGPTLMNRLLAHFGDFDTILRADERDLRGVPGIGPQIAASILAINLDQVACDLARFERDGLRALLWTDAAYPVRLRTLPDHPLLVFVKGHLAEADQRAVAIVGTRQPTPAALDLTKTWAAGLAQHGFTIISGLARGIDTGAHRSAVQAGGRSIAVLGSGLEQIYPPENAELAMHIANQGSLLSEVHPHTHVAPNALIFRNRVITALSLAVLVMECGLDSGAMNAAKRAQAQGRPVYAPPGSPGNEHLLADFARPLPTSLSDFLADLRQ